MNTNEIDDTGQQAAVDINGNEALAQRTEGQLPPLDGVPAISQSMLGDREVGQQANVDVANNVAMNVTCKDGGAANRSAPRPFVSRFFTSANGAPARFTPPHGFTKATGQGRAVEKRAGTEKGQKHSNDLVVNGNEASTQRTFYDEETGQAYSDNVNDNGKDASKRQQGAAKDTGQASSDHVNVSGKVAVARQKVAGTEKRQKRSSDVNADAIGSEQPRVAPYVKRKEKGQDCPVEINDATATEQPRGIRKSSRRPAPTTVWSPKKEPAPKRRGLSRESSVCSHTSSIAHRRRDSFVSNTSRASSVTNTNVRGGSVSRCAQKKRKEKEMIVSPNKNGAGMGQPQKVAKGRRSISLDGSHLAGTVQAACVNSLQDRSPRLLSMTQDAVRLRVARRSKEGQKAKRTSQDAEREKDDHALENLPPLLRLSSSPEAGQVITPSPREVRSGRRSTSLTKSSGRQKQKSASAIRAEEWRRSKEQQDSQLGETPKGARKRSGIRGVATSAEKKNRRRSDARQKDKTAIKSIYPRWFRKSEYGDLKRSDVGQLIKRCPYCGALHFPKELYRCCDNGRVRMPELPNPPPVLFETLTRATPRARKNIQKISNINTLLAFGARQCELEQVKGRGVPTVKQKGAQTHTASCVFPTIPKASPHFGALYVRDNKEATQIRAENVRVAEGVDTKLLEELGQEMKLNNELAACYKDIATILAEQAAANGGLLPHTTMRIVSREEAMKNPAARKIIEADHGGRYNQPDKTMVTLMVPVDETEKLLFPKGLNVYSHHLGGPGRPVAFFDPLVNCLCYPVFHPYGKVEWKPSFLPLVKPEKLTEEQLKKLEDAGKKDGGNDGGSEEDASEMEEGSECGSEQRDEEADDPTDTAENWGLFNKKMKRRLLEEGEDFLEFGEMSGEPEELPLHPDPSSAEAEEDEVLEHLPEADQASEHSGDEYRSAPQSDEEDGDPAGREEVVEEYLVDEPEEDDVLDQQGESEDAAEMQVVEGQDDEDEGGTGVTCTKKQRYVSHLQWLRYRLARRVSGKDAFHHIFAAPRLSQTYIIDNWLRIEEQRLWHDQQHNTFVSSSKSAFFKSMEAKASKKNRRLGIATVVPNRHKGSHGYMRAKYEDTMAMICALGKPDLFITFTGNRKWPEIEAQRGSGHTWADDADIAVRVFMEKFKEFKKLVLDTGKIFGKVKGYAYSFELQQRGMPHAHCLVILEDGCKLDTPAKVDDVVWARLPNPDDYADPKMRKEAMGLLEKVERHMVHTPCEQNVDSYCREKLRIKSKKEKKSDDWVRCCRCDKSFPHPYSSHTLFVSDGYVEPRRPDDGMTVCKKATDGSDVIADNRHVVPYNPVLLEMFDSHINVEICSTVKACKYIFKYIFKGYDKALAEFVETCWVSNGSKRGSAGAINVGGHVVLPAAARMSRAKHNQWEREAAKRLKEKGIPLFDENGKRVLVYDETIIYQSLRSLTVAEALLGIYQVNPARLSHVVVQLCVHEPGEERVSWKKGEEDKKLEALQQNKNKATSQLTAWFKLNQSDPEARTLTYNEIPLRYKWEYKKMCWTRRSAKDYKKYLTRIYTVSPRYMEKFAIRQLCGSVAGAESFEDLRTFEGVVYDTFHAAAKARGLMNNEKEWEDAMEVAAKTAMPGQIRQLFATIVAYCPVKDKQALFDKFAEEMFDRGSASPATKRARALFHIQSILKNNNTTLKNAGLEEVIENDLDWVSGAHYDDGNRIRETPEEADKLADEMISKMNEEQKKALETLLEAAQPGSRQRCFFLDGPGGTGKTYVYRALFYKLYALQGSVKTLCVAHTGIAATLLPCGSTVHRQFCVPIVADEGQLTSRLAPDSELEAKVRAAEVIIWDEATMSDKRVFACVEKLLAELEETDGRPFGGKLILLGGDWKQLLPVVRRTYSRGVLDYTLKRSGLWHNFKVLQLQKNMRVELGSDKFAELLDKVGRAAAPVHNEDTGMVTLPREMFVESDDHLIEWAYGGSALDVNSCEQIKDTCILSVLNDATMEINEKVLAMLPGQKITLKSHDRCAQENAYMEFPADLYNSITPSGFPPHKLELKRGAVVILLRNIDVSKGQCNGTRMRVMEIDQALLKCEIITDGPFKGQEVLIPRIEMEPADQTDPSHCFKRLQFPVRLAYAMTINKAQGQSLKKVGVSLRNCVFTHGQLYVALSRARTQDGVRIYLPDLPEEGDVDVLNFVYRDILQ